MNLRPIWLMRFVSCDYATLIQGMVFYGLMSSLFLALGCQEPDVFRYQSMLEGRIEKPQTIILDERQTESADENAETGLPREPIHLNRAIEIAFVNSPRLKVMQKNIQIAKEDIQVAGSSFWPQVSVGGNYNLLSDDISTGDGPLLESQFWQAELDLQWMLWDFGRSSGQYQQSNIAHDISKINYRRFQQALIYEISQSYYNILRAQKAKTIASDGLAAAKLQLNTASQLFSQGQVTKDDVLRAEVQVARYELGVIQASNAVRLALSHLNRSMGINVNWPTEIVDTDEQPAFVHDLAWALEQAIENRPELEQIQLGIAFDQAGVSITKAEYLPRLFVSGSLMHIEDQGHLDESVAIGTLGIQIDLFTGGRRNAQVKQAEYRMSQAINKAQEVCDTISFEVKQAYLGINDADARLPVAYKALSAAAENARLVQEKYKNSLATATDVADAEAAHTQAQQDYYRALYDLMSAIERLQFAMGTNDDFHKSARTDS